jgi:hypothetical protein
MNGPSSGKPDKDKRIANGLTASPDATDAAFDGLRLSTSYATLFRDRMGSVSSTGLPSRNWPAGHQNSTTVTEGVATNPSLDLDESLRMIFSQPGYTLAKLLDTRPGPHTRLEPAEVLATCFRGAEGNFPRAEWAESLLTGDNAPLATTLRALGLVIPVSDVYEDTAKFLLQNHHPDIGTVFAAAARTTHSVVFSQSLVLKARACSAEVFTTVLAGARENENANQEELNSIETDHLRLCRELSVSELESIPPQNADKWHTPQLSTLAILLATSQQEEEFSKKVDELVERFPKYAAPTIAAIANTRNEELRHWCLVAFERPELKDYAPLIRFLPVSAYEPEESFY